jgi:hypothetical protein
MSYDFWNPAPSLEQGQLFIYRSLNYTFLNENKFKKKRGLFSKDLTFMSGNLEFNLIKITTLLYWYDAAWEIWRNFQYGSGHMRVTLCHEYSVIW